MGIRQILLIMVLFAAGELLSCLAREKTAGFVVEIPHGSVVHVLRGAISHAPPLAIIGIGGKGRWAVVDPERR